MNLLANFVAAVKSALLQRRQTVSSRSNNMVLRVCTLLDELGYIGGFTILNNTYVKVYLKYYNNKSVIRTLACVSKPSMRVYIGKKNIFGRGMVAPLETNAFLALSTSSSSKLLTDIECFMLSTGGEAIVSVG